MPLRFSAKIDIIFRGCIDARLNKAYKRIQMCHFFGLNMSLRFSTKIDLIFRGCIDAHLNKAYKRIQMCLFFGFA